MRDSHVGRRVGAQGEHVVGVITDRDLATHYIPFEKLNPDTRVDEYMTPGPKWNGLERRRLGLMPLFTGRWMSDETRS